jgi:lysine-N-methylase
MQELTSVPRYLASFSCNGPSCPDSCCSGWNIHLDAATHQKWQTIRLVDNGPPLASRTRPPPADQAGDADSVAMMERTPSGDCTWLGSDKLCVVQSALGESALPLVCHTYPRGVTATQDGASMFLSLGCPQAARLALADAKALDMVPAQRQPTDRLPPPSSPHTSAVATIDQFAVSSADGIHAAADMLAQAALRLIRSPQLTVWQAWALYWRHAVGFLAALTSEPNRQSAAEQLRALEHLSRREEGLQAAAELAERTFVAKALPMPTRLHAALRYTADAARRVDSEFNHPRRTTHTQALALVHAMAPFGLDEDPSPTDLEAASRLYQQGLRQWFEPFDNAHPHLLKNHLLNRLLLRNFPVSGAARFGEEVAHETMDLDALRVLLVGQALTKRSEFGIDDYVVLVQAFTRHVAHPMHAKPPQADA